MLHPARSKSIVLILNFIFLNINFLFDKFCCIKRLYLKAMIICKYWIQAKKFLQTILYPENNAFMDSVDDINVDNTVQKANLYIYMHRY